MIPDQYENFLVIPATAIGFNQREYSNSYTNKCIETFQKLR